MAPELKEVESGKSFARRDLLRCIEKKVQRRWEEADVFRADSKATAPAPGEKFFGNFPYPYMNGSLHIGHGFSLSKLEFASAFHRLCGRNVLLPFAFHCTGMPIKASADKLAREIKIFGNPPVFPGAEAAMEENIKLEAEEKPDASAPDKFKSKRSKAAAKSGVDKHQWDIMRSFGLSDAEIASFQDPRHWLTHFPPIAKEDLKSFGLGCDWRRSFITTDVNPFYDSFVRWQMRKLKAMGKIVKAVRYAIYSPLDGQPCADHDRATGEGVQPQDYVLIKMEVLPPLSGKLKILEGKRVFLAAATLRPETMYGQTNCWVLPEGKYGAFEINDSEVFIVTARAALNLAYQKLSRVPEKPSCLVELTGYDLIGLSLISPLSFNKTIYALPMLTILTDKGTGIVTSVPSDSPDDFMALQDLKTKPALRAKYGVEDEWILPFDVIPIIRIPEFGDKAAEKVCLDLKIKSQNEKDKLAEAKRLTYLKGFTEGVMLVGDFAGKPVQEAKPLIRSSLVQKGAAVIYSEPERRVMSRSGDECIVALTDQWYITYGEEDWKRTTEVCLSRMNLFSEESRHGFEHTLGWLNQWACSRSFGLGTRIPWDEQFLVESLSDSTLYMAYYTVAHLLQQGDMYGSSYTVLPDQLTDEVWDFVFCGGATPKNSDLPPELLRQMKQEFEYWYPFDLRVSGKDLIQNHLTFCIYNHTALFPENHWPLGFRCNGHIMLNSEKMSKSTGNFKTLQQSIEEFSADATRFALADAGDGMDDANFVTDTANAAILRLTKELTWMEEVLAADKMNALRSGSAVTYADRVFANEIDLAVHAAKQSYSNFMFRDALKTGFYDLQAARDEYRLSCGGAAMHKDLIFRFMDVQTRLISPICPHYGEHVWAEILGRDGFVVKAGWPVASPPDPTLKKANRYLQDTIVLMRKLKEKQEFGAKKSKKVVAAQPPRQLTTGLIYVNEEYDGWKESCLRVLRSKYDDEKKMFAPDQEIIEVLKGMKLEGEKSFKQLQKECMPFVKFKKDEVNTVGSQALDLRLPFGEIEVLRENVDLIRRQLQLENVEVLDFNDEVAVERAGSFRQLLLLNRPEPGQPTAIFLSADD